MAQYSDKYLLELRETIAKVYKNKTFTTREIQFLHWRFLEYPENYTENDNLNEVLEYYNQYIDIILKYSESNNFETYKIYRTNISKYMSVISYVGSCSSLVNKFVDGITVPIFEHITDPSIKTSCSIELIRAYNNIIRNCDKSVKDKLANSGARIYLYKLADLLCSCGDYEYQATILETIFRICQGNQIKLLAAEFFPGTESLQHALVKFDIEDFDNSTRTFLNIVNKVFQNVYSFVATNILLDDENVTPPMDVRQKQTQLWVDCNKSSGTISIYCNQSCLRSLPFSYLHESEYLAWELIIISVDDVSLVEIKRDKGKSKTQKSSTVFKFSLTNPFYVQLPPSENASNSKCLKIAITDEDIIHELKTSVYPAMFKEKFQGFRGNRKSKKNDSSLLEVDISYQKSSYKPLAFRTGGADSKSVKSADTRSTKSVEDLLGVKHPIGIMHTHVGIKYVSPNSTVLDDSLVGPVCIPETQYFSADEHLSDDQDLRNNTKVPTFNAQPIIYQSYPVNNDADVSKTKEKIKVKFPFNRKQNKKSFDPLFSPIYESTECSKLEQNESIRKSSTSNQSNGKCEEHIFAGTEVIKATPDESSPNKSIRKTRKGKRRQTSQKELVNNDITDPYNDLEMNIKKSSQYLQESIPNLRSKKKSSQEKLDTPSNNDNCSIKCNDIFSQTNETTKRPMEHKSQTIINTGQTNLVQKGVDVNINGENNKINEVVALADTCGYSNTFWNELDKVVKEAELQHMKKSQENNSTVVEPVTKSQKDDTSLEAIEHIHRFSVSENIQENLSFAYGRRPKKNSVVVLGSQKQLSPVDADVRGKLVKAPTPIAKPNYSETHINIPETDIETKSNERSVLSSQKEQNQIKRIRKTLEQLLKTSSEEKFNEDNYLSVLHTQPLELDQAVEVSSKPKLSQNVGNKSLNENSVKSQKISQSNKITNTDSEIFSLVKNIGEPTFEFTEASNESIIHMERNRSKTGTMEYEETSVVAQNQNNKTDSSVFIEQPAAIEIIEIDSDAEEIIKTNKQIINRKAISNKASSEIISDDIAINRSNGDQLNLKQPFKIKIKSHQDLMDSDSTFVDEDVLDAYKMNEIDTSQKNLLQPEGPDDAGIVESAVIKLGDGKLSGKIEDVVDLTELLDIDKNEIDMQINQVDEKAESITIQDSNSDVSSYVISGSSIHKTKRWRSKGNRFQESETTDHLNTNEVLDINDARINAIEKFITHQNSLFDELSAKTEKTQDLKEIDNLTRNIETILCSQKQKILKNEDIKVPDEHAVLTGKLEDISTDKKTQKVKDETLDLHVKQRRNRKSLYTTDELEKCQGNNTENVDSRTKRIPDIKENDSFLIKRQSNRSKKLRKLASNESVNIPKCNLDINSTKIKSQSGSATLNKNQLDNQVQTLRRSSRRKSNRLDLKDKQLDVDTCSEENAKDQNKVIIEKSNNIESKVLTKMVEVDSEINGENLKRNSQNNDEDDIFLQSTYKLSTQDRNEKIESVIEHEKAVAEFKYQAEINKTNNFESKMKDKEINLNNNEVEVTELQKKPRNANISQDKFTKSFKMSQADANNDNLLLKNLLTNQLLINNDHDEINEDTDKGATVTLPEENNRGPVYDVYTETVISSSQKSKASNLKRKLSQSDTKLFLKRKKRLYDPNDFSYLENDNTTNYGQTISTLVTYPTKSQKQNERKTSTIRKTRTSTNKTKAVRNTRNCVRYNERASIIDSTIESLILDGSSAYKFDPSCKPLVKRQSTLPNLKEMTDNIGKEKSYAENSNDTQKQITKPQLRKLYHRTEQDQLHTNFQPKTNSSNRKTRRKIILTSSSESDNEPPRRLKVVAQIHSIPKEVPEPLNHPELVKNVVKAESTINKDVNDDIMEISYPKHVSTPIAKNRKRRKPVSRKEYKPETTKLEETDQKIFDSFLLSFTKSVNETTTRIDRKMPHLKRTKTTGKTKQSKRKQFSSDDEIDFYKAPKRTNHQSKIKILENIVLQAADERLETNYDALKKSPTILKSKTFNGPELIDHRFMTNQILKILCLILDLLVKYGQFTPDENEVHKTFLQQCSDIQKTMKKLL